MSLMERENSVHRSKRTCPTVVRKTYDDVIVTTPDGIGKTELLHADLHSLMFKITMTLSFRFHCVQLASLR
jgi:hypothetical protein